MNPTSKAALWMISSAPGYVLQKGLGNLPKAGLIAQELVGDPVDRHRPGIDLPFWLEILMEIVAG